MGKVIQADYAIIGAGIMGLSIARELLLRDAKAKIIILEKEAQLGMHGSGRNSGVLHSGIYYKEQSLKAKVCAQGAKLMTAFCKEYRIPINHIGKVIVPTKIQDDSNIEVLYQRAKTNGAAVEIIDAKQLQEIEPYAFSASGRALYSPETAVVDSKKVLQTLVRQLFQQHVTIIYQSQIIRVDPKDQKIYLPKQTISYGHLFNTAGLHADQVAKQFGFSDRYAILPFKGLYYELVPDSTLTIKKLIYPVPDLNMPFLGVHFTVSVQGKIYVGPTAVPAFGREHYRGFAGINLKDSFNVIYHLIKQYILNKQCFRAYMHAESLRCVKSKFVTAAKELVPKLAIKDLILSEKVGIRAQLLDKVKNELVMDFVVENDEHTTHVLNAVSPGFTSAFSFSKHIIDNLDRS